MAEGFTGIRVMVLAIAIAGSAAYAEPTGDVRAQRQATVTYVLTQDSLETVQRIRAGCAAGRESEWIAKRRALGFNGIPDAADYCASALTRLGREGLLSFVRSTQGGKPTPSLAFDGGFVAAYQRHEPVTSALPTMRAVKPIAARCLAQREPDTDLCSAAGYAFGARAAQGEVVSVE